MAKNTRFKYLSAHMTKLLETIKHDRQENKTCFETLEQMMDTLLQQQRTLNNSGQHHGEAHPRLILAPTATISGS